jgi:hypothetical protein
MHRLDQSLQKCHHGLFMLVNELHVGADRRIVNHRQGRKLNRIQAAFFRLKVEWYVDVGGVDIVTANTIDARGTHRKA